jgi:hypothetical protein
MRVSVTIPNNAAASIIIQITRVRPFLKYHPPFFPVSPLNYTRDYIINYALYKFVQHL